MEDPDILQRKLFVSIDPAMVVLNCVKKMKDMSSWALLIVRRSKIQILTSTPNRLSCAILEADSNITFASWSDPNGYALHIDLNIWFQRLNKPILLEPAASAFYLRKISGSANLCCIIGNKEQMIDLGPAVFVQQRGIDLNSLNCRVRVTVETEWFIEAMRVFGEDNNEVHLVINSNGTLNWVGVPSGSNMNHPVEINHLSSSITESDLQLKLKWTWPLYQVLSYAIHCYDRVEVSIVTDTLGNYWYRLRFSTRFHSNIFNYLDRRPAVVAE